jgi:transcriptional regulator with XRE-family HTH domain
LNTKQLKKYPNIPNMQPISDTPLADFVRETMRRKHLTIRDVEQRSGGQITHSYVNKIKNGYGTNPSPAMIKALARGLGESEETLFAVVRGITPDPFRELGERFEMIASKLRLIPEAEREKINLLIDLIEREIEFIMRENEIALLVPLGKPAKNAGTALPFIGTISAGPIEKTKKLVKKKVERKVE